MEIARSLIIILTYRNASASSRAGGEGGPRAHKRAAVNKKIKVDKVSLIITMGIYKKGYYENKRCNKDNRLIYKNF